MSLAARSCSPLVHQMGAGSDTAGSGRRASVSVVSASAVPHHERRPSMFTPQDVSPSDAGLWLPGPEDLTGTHKDVTCQFKKLLVQEVLYQSMPFTHRTAMHRRAALALEEQLHMAETTAANLVRKVCAR